MIYGQEYASSMDMTTKTGQEPVTYHQAFNSTNKVLYRYRVYKVASISLNSVQAKRTKRSLIAATTTSFTFRVGTGATTCPSTQEFCDGPLQPGTQYRFAVVAVYNNGGATPPLLVYSPLSQPATTSGSPTTGAATGSQTSVHVNALVVWIVALVVMGTLFWLAVLALAIVLCYKRRYSHDKAYDLGYNGPPVPNSGSAYAFDNKASIHYSEVTTVNERKVDKADGRVAAKATTHAPVVLDSPERTPPMKTKLKTYDESLSTSTFTPQPETVEVPQQEFETHSAKLKFDDENPEWESMDIQLRIDPTGERDPVITRKETKKEDRHGSVEDLSSGSITANSTTIRQVVDDDGGVVEETRTDELSRV